MTQSSAEWQLKIRQQYDSFCKTLLKHEMIDYERERRYREKHEIPLAGFSEEEVEQLHFVFDKTRLACNIVKVRRRMAKKAKKSLCFFMDEIWWNGIVQLRICCIMVGNAVYHIERNEWR